MLHSCFYVRFVFWKLPFWVEIPRLYYYCHLPRMNEAQQYTLWFPDYLFIRYIGKGSYGDVFYCIRKRDNARVVLKIVGITHRFNFRFGVWRVSKTAFL